MNPLSEIELLREMLTLGGAIILRNEYGTTELKKGGFTIRSTEGWYTAYPADAANAEEKSHFHLRRNRFIFAEVIELDGFTPQIAFWGTKDRSDAVGPVGKPPFAIYFPTFYIWGNEKVAVTEHHNIFNKWITIHGKVWSFITD